MRGILSPSPGMHMHDSKSVHVALLQPCGRLALPAVDTKKPNMSGPAPAQATPSATGQQISTRGPETSHITKECLGDTPCR
jgi:hypothetical protein